MELIIDGDVSSFQRKLSQEEYDQLEENVLADGRIIDPIVVWRGHDVIVDGENRYLIAKKHGLNFTVDYVDFADKSEVKKWVAKHQLGRRNLDGLALTVMRGKLFAECGDAADVAGLFDVSTRQVYRDAQTVKAYEELPEDIQERVKKGAIVASDRSVRKFGELNEVQKEKAVSELRKNPEKGLHEVLPDTRVKTNISDEDRQIVDRVLNPSVRQRISLGGITADHAAIQKLNKLDPISQETVDDILTGGEIVDLGAAIEILNVKTTTRKPMPLDALKLRNQIADTFAKLKRLVDDLGETIGKNVEVVQDTLKIAESNLP